jgi:Holliday junction resolvase
MSQQRYDAKRDENEQQIIQALRKAGYFVTRLNDPGVPDLLVVKPSKHLKISIARNVARALRIAQSLDYESNRMALIEIKMPGKDLNETQTKWWNRALNIG